MCTVENLRLLKISHPDSLLYIRGHIPGPTRCWVEIRDAKKRPPRLPPPFPTDMTAKLGEYGEVISKKQRYKRMKYPDPYEKGRTIDWETKWADAAVALHSAQQSGKLDDDDDFDLEGEGLDDLEGGLGGVGAKGTIGVKGPAKGTAGAKAGAGAGAGAGAKTGAGAGAAKGGAAAKGADKGGAAAKGADKGGAGAKGADKGAAGAKGGDKAAKSTPEKSKGKPSKKVNLK